jgi:CYTH domain-containing protein
MPVTRRFIIARPFARLIQKECGSEGVTEGHFAPHSERQSHVRVESGRSHLILTLLDASPEAAEDITDLPSVHAEALLEAAAGRVALQRSRLRLGSLEALVDRYTVPGQLNLASVELATGQEADAFTPPAWFGAEVTQDESYTRRAIALSGLPHASEPAVSDAALDALLDHLEGVPSDASSDRPEPELKAIAAEDSTFAALRRLAALPNLPRSRSELAEGTPSEVAELKARRRVLETQPDHQAGADDRLASVINGLSEALAQTPADQNGSASETAQSHWRWSAP